MSEKNYCCVPESYKELYIYDAGRIREISDLDVTKTKPSSQFKYCIDDYDKVKLFFFDRQESDGSTDDENYLTYKMMQYIKSIFKVNELYDFRLITDSDARAEFTVLYDVNGNHIHTTNVVNKNKTQTVVGHRYTYNLYKRYN